MRTPLSVLFLFIFLVANAQIDAQLFERSYEIDSLCTGDFAVELDNVSFFKDNEYSGELITGYTLPGLWVQPKLTFQPLNNLNLELGFHSLIYAGKLKYPNMGYQDIGMWKGDDYTEGTHILPFFRANIQMGKVHFVLGDIFGGANHRLIEPLYSRELNMTNDPEMGLQVLVDLKRWHLDTWINWQSFIFKGDTHQESFIFGGNSELNFGKWTIPMQVIVQHRGGEIQTDSAHHGVQTLINAAVGARLEQPIHTQWLTKVTAEAEATYYLQQSGSLYSIKNGWGAYARTLMNFRHGINLDLNYFKNMNYVPVLGDGHFCCMKTSDKSVVYKRPDILNAAIEYSKTFAKRYTFGARADIYCMWLHPGMKCDMSFGVFLKANPRFLLKKF